MANQLELIATLQVLGAFWLIGGLALPVVTWMLFQQPREGSHFLLGVVAGVADVVLLLAFCILWSELKLPSHDWHVVALYVLTPLLPNLVGIFFAIIFREWKKSRADAEISMVYR